jgi:hypothetical protein
MLGLEHRTGLRAALLLTVALVAPAAARADVIISSAATENMSCSGGVCAPTAKKAVLNVSDLEALFANGDVEVTTTGSGVQADNIKVAGALSWSNNSILELNARGSVVIDKEVSISNVAGLKIITNRGRKGSALEFGHRGHVDFGSLSSVFSLNGVTYRLESSLPNLALQMNKDPNGAYALVENYDASQDGIFGAPPILAPFGGSFNGLGHEISHVVIEDDAGSYIGLFASLLHDATMSSFRLRDSVIIGTDENAVVGGIAGLTQGTIDNSSVKGGVIEGSNNVSGVGGLTGYLDTNGSIINCSSSVSVRGSYYAGGVAGFNAGSIETSYANGDAHDIGSGDEGSVGALVGINSGDFTGLAGNIVNSYATGPVKNAYAVGGLIGYNPEYSTVETSYSTGLAWRSQEIGGFIGDNQGAATNSYWDTTTSDTTQSVGEGNDTGITGLTTEQLQAGLPTGFDPKVWAENPRINNGLPYLIDNPPEK